MPALNGLGGREVGVKQCYFPKEFQRSNESSCFYDYAILELEENLGKEFGYMGIDAS